MPFQLVLRQNPKFPSTFIDRSPAYTQTNTSKTLTDNSQAHHRAKEAITASKNSENTLCSES